MLASECCSEIFPLNGRSAVIRTELGEDHWEERLGQWWEQDPTQAALQLRRKRLTNDGAVSAAAPGTGAQQKRLAAGAAEVSSRVSPG